jgi:hypothetical protein
MFLGQSQQVAALRGASMKAGDQLMSSGWMTGIFADLILNS